MPGQATRPPFTRTTVTDIQSAAFAISDIYDKLNSVALSINQPAASPSSAQGTAPAVSSPDPSVRTISSSSPLLPSDTTVLALIRSDTSIVLPDTRGYPSRPQWIKNSADSTANLNLQSTVGQTVDVAAASSYTLLPGQAICIIATSSGWSVLGQL